ncbi:hypothetical protein BI308_18655 [Roseofilum reptotaenium AO1-A]|uniref:Uncharacterized protein n=1 Tax=Roseofilum reptotaenium AO1-A TaxID=1925591 RepID=A0A1L9QN50_9CYAN|nr:hypothetical protein BI308_18655 [Roseofilum reptotaenium AO1-A]
MKNLCHPFNIYLWPDDNWCFNEDFKLVDSTLGSHPLFEYSQIKSIYFGTDDWTYFFMSRYDQYQLLE